MAMFGFTLNNLTLFGLVLAVGIVVDDAIVVVENVERNIAAGLQSARGRDQEHGRGRRRADRDRAGAVRGVRARPPSSPAFPGSSTGSSRSPSRARRSISLIVSLTLSPALCALLLKPHDPQHRDRWWERPIRGFFRMFNCGFDEFAARLWLARRAVVRFAVIMLLVYAGILAFGLNEFRKTPIGFIPQLDRGYLIVAANCRRAPSLARTDEVHAPRRRDRAEDAGRRRRGEHRRLLRRDLHQCAERRRDLPRARPVREARAAIRAQSADGIQRELFGKLRGDPGGADLRGAAAAGAGHRQCRRLPHDGRGPRRARPAGAAGGGLRDDGRGGADAGPARRCSRCSRPRRRSSISTSTAPRRSCSASTCRTCSPRCRSISARPTSTTSTCSAAPSA